MPPPSRMAALFPSVLPMIVIFCTAGLVDAPPCSAGAIGGDVATVADLHVAVGIVIPPPQARPCSASRAAR